jgi:hypothetical protein
MALPRLTKLELQIMTCGAIADFHPGDTEAFPQKAGLPTTIQTTCTAWKERARCAV